MHKNKYLDDKYNLTRASLARASLRVSVLLDNSNT